MRLHVVGRFTLWLCAVSALSPGAAAQQSGRPDARGRWQFAKLDRRPPAPGVTDQDVDALYQKLILAAMPFRQSPVLFRPKGVEVQPLLRAVPTPDDSGPRPLAGELRLQLFPLYADCPACAVKTGTVSVSLHVWANYPEPLYADAERLQDEQGRMYAAPIGKGTIEGFPDYEVRGTGTRFVVVSASKRPLWLPVTQQRVIESELSKARADLSQVAEGATAMSSMYQEWLAGKAERKRQREEMTRQLIQQMPKEAEKWRAQAKQMELMEEQTGEQLKASEGTNQVMGDQMTEQARASVTRLEAELAALTPEQRTQPVYLGQNGVRLPVTSPPDTVTGSALVAPNPKVFDPALPKSAIQLLIVEVPRARDETFAPFLNRKTSEIQASLDWARLTEPLRAR